MLIVSSQPSSEWTSNVKYIIKIMNRTNETCQQIFNSNSWTTHHYNCLLDLTPTNYNDPNDNHMTMGLLKTQHKSKIEFSNITNKYFPII